MSAADGAVAGYGYSGHGEGVNNPALESVPNVGPIPAGRWTIGAAEDNSRLGPVAMPLTPVDTDATFGRGGFFIHGDSVEFAGQEEASHGCIILARDVRELIAASGDTDLAVI
jgi:hypothetical protein